MSARRIEVPRTLRAAWAACKVPAASLALIALLAGAPGEHAAEARDAPASTPRLRIETPRGGQTRERVISVAGSLQDIRAERLTLVLNGVPLSIARQGNRFSSDQVLAPGWNGVRVEALEGDRVISDEIAVYASVPRKDLRITLTWDTPATDIDLWVTGPDGEKISYQQRTGVAGGSLDTDVTTGFGPETYTHARAPKGAYRVQAHYYGSGKRPITRVTVTTVLYEGTPKERRTVLKGVLLAPKELLEVGEIVVP